jgi:hypothetical protein
MNPAHVHPSNFLKKVLILFSHLPLSFPKWLCSFGFLRKTPVQIFPLPIGSTSPTHLVLVDFISLIIFREYKGRKLVDM